MKNHNKAISQIRHLCLGSGFFLLFVGALACVAESEGWTSDENEPVSESVSAPAAEPEAESTVEPELFDFVGNEKAEEDGPPLQRMLISAAIPANSVKTTLGDTSLNGPALATSGPSVLIAWTGTGNQQLNFMRTDDGRNTYNKKTLSEKSPSAPALAFFNKRWYVAWRGTDNRLHVMSSSDGKSWGSKVILSETSPSSPALAVFNGHLYLAWRGTGNNQLNWLRSTNGTSWGNKVTSSAAAASQKTLSGPAMVGFNGRLWISWRAAGALYVPANTLCATFSNNGTEIIIPTCIHYYTTESRPALYFRGNKAFLSWQRAGNRRLSLVPMLSLINREEVYSEDANLYTSPETSIDGPALSAINGKLLWAWTGTDGRLNLMFTPQ